MKIESLSLKNIRSYAEAEIFFNNGITLFEGDIGSGKSTILMAIEFVLFGLGSEKGAALLRIGSSKGHVALDFQVDGSKYTAYRSLSKRKNGIQQDKCYILADNIEYKLSPTEMKERILQILNFNEPANSRAKSVIYRYAVFTPQEEMKAIINMSPDQRLQTLRKALRIEDYKIAMNNALNLSRIIDKKSAEYKSMAINLKTNESDLLEKKKELEKADKNIEKLSKECKEVMSQKEKLEEEIKIYQEIKNKLSQVSGQIPLIKKAINQKAEEIRRLNENNILIQTTIKDKLEPKILKIKGQSPPTDKKPSELTELLGHLRNAENNFTTRIATVETKIKDYEIIENSSICPTCEQTLDPEKIKTKIQPLRKQFTELEQKLEECEKSILDTEELKIDLQNYNLSQKDIENIQNQINRDNGQLEINSEKIQELTVLIKEEKINLENLNKEVEEGKNTVETIEKLEDHQRKLSEKLSTVQQQYSSNKTTLNILNGIIKDLNDKIKKDKLFKQKGEKLQEYYIWIKEYFIPSLENIENQVMMSINLEFNQHFQRWFSILVDDPDKTANINEDFTPIIEQDGYEQEIDYLSGGEKTSVALAYRLALNSIVQRVSTGIKSDVLILDEPTDGFSKEQLFKLREILEELECPQIILVSHEKELESFADHIYRIEKREGKSIISS